MKAVIQPGEARGTIRVPPSKSIMQRACAAALIRGGKNILHNPGNSDDDQVALKIIAQLGATVIRENENLVIESNGLDAFSSHLHFGESGLSARMFIPVASILKEEIHISGEGSLLTRPFVVYDSILPQLGVKYGSKKGYLPIQVRGPLVPADIEMDGTLSSQFLTGLLMAYAAADASDVTIKVPGLNSKPYVDLTLQVMTDFGLKVPLNNGYREFYFGQQSITQFSNQTIQYEVEGDWSGAAFLMVAGAISGDVTITGLDVFSRQADRMVLQPLMQSGAIMSIEEKSIRVRKNDLQPFHFNAADCPDLFPPLVSLAANCNGISVIEGVGRLQHKESNRGEVLQGEFLKLGIEIKLQDDLMVITGAQNMRGAEVDSHKDHRIAMACAISALNSKEKVVISHAEAVSKSYPRFWDHMQQLNAELSLINN